MLTQLMNLLIGVPERRQRPDASDKELSVSVSVVDVRVVGMRMDQFLVSMPVRVRLAGRIVRRVCVLVMLVVVVKVFVFHRFVPVQVFVPLGQVQPNTDRHEHRCHPEADSRFVAQEQN